MNELDAFRSVFAARNDGPLSRMLARVWVKAFKGQRTEHLTSIWNH